MTTYARIASNIHVWRVSELSVMSMGSKIAIEDGGHSVSIRLQCRCSGAPKVKKTTTIRNMRASVCRKRLRRLAKRREEDETSDGERPKSHRVRYSTRPNPVPMRPAK